MGFARCVTLDFFQLGKVMGINGKKWVLRGVSHAIFSNVFRLGKAMEINGEKWVSRGVSHAIFGSCQVSPRNF